MSENPIKTTFRPARLLLCFLLAALIFASWKLPATRTYWDVLDRTWFYWANGSLATGSHAWQVFWAVLNHRAFDVLPGSLLIALFAHHAWKCHRDDLTARIAVGLFMGIYCVMVVQCVRLMVLEPRLSPTLVLEHANRLTHLVPYIATKDNSTFSFPGDHALVMTLVACFIGYFCGRRYGLPAFIIAVLCSFPRMVGGAHWLTDVAISATSIPLVAVPLVIYTPLGGKIISWLNRKCQHYLTPILRRYLPFI